MQKLDKFKEGMREQVRVVHGDLIVETMVGSIEVLAKAGLSSGQIAKHMIHIAGNLVTALPYDQEPMRIIANYMTQSGERMMKYADELEAIHTKAPTDSNKLN